MRSSALSTALAACVEKVRRRMGESGPGARSGCEGGGRGGKTRAAGRGARGAARGKEDGMARGAAAAAEAAAAAAAAGAGTATCDGAWVAALAVSAGVGTGCPRAPCASCPCCSCATPLPKAFSSVSSRACPEEALSGAERSSASSSRGSRVFCPPAPASPSAAPAAPAAPAAAAAPPLCAPLCLTCSEAAGRAWLKAWAWGAAASPTLPMLALVLAPAVLAEALCT